MSIVHYVLENTGRGRILSRPQAIAFNGHTPGRSLNTLCVACDESIGLPTGQDDYVCSNDPRVVTCPACQATPDFQKQFAVQTGFDFASQKPLEPEALKVLRAG